LANFAFCLSWSLGTWSHLLQQPGREGGGRIETDRIPDLEAGNPVFGGDLCRPDARNYSIIRRHPEIFEITHHDRRQRQCENPMKYASWPNNFAHTLRTHAPQVVHVIFSRE